MTEELQIIAHHDLPGDYRLIRIISKYLSQKVAAGGALFLSKLQLTLPYLRQDPTENKIDFLFTITEKTKHLMTGSTISDYEWHISPPQTQRLKNNVIIYPNDQHHFAQGLAVALDANFTATNHLFLFELGQASPFKLQPSRFYLPFIPAGIIANLSMLEEKKIVARFCSRANLPGCFDGTLEQLLVQIGDQDAGFNSV